MSTKAGPIHEPLSRLVGSWSTEITHPAFPGAVVRGTVSVEWLEGEQFLIHRARTDHPDFPDSISIIGSTERARADTAGGDLAATGKPALSMHYYDSRGVFRAYEASMDDDEWRIWRDDPGFSQRFSGTLSDGGHTLAGLWQLRKDDGRWNDDLRITYRREP